MVVLIGGPGAEPARAIAEILAESPGSAAVLQASDLAALIGGAEGNSAALAMEEGLRHAQRAKLPLIIDHRGIGASPHDTLAAFKGAGFSTRIVLTVERDSASALTSTTRRLRSRALGVSVSPVVSVADEWVPVMDTVRGIPDELLDRITVLDGDGAVVHDGPPSQQTWAAVAGARRSPLSGMQGVAWLSELRRIGEYVASARDSLAREDLASVEHLYAIAQTQVLPELPVRPDSTAATVQRERLQAERAQIKRLILEADHVQPAPPSLPGAGPNVSR
jgi:hypothetical protein